MRTPLAAAVLVTALAAVAPPAAADAVLLRDGRFLDDVLARRDGDALVLTYRNGEIRLPLSMVADFTATGGDAWEPTSDEEREKRAQGLVPFEGRWVKADVRTRALAKQREERKKALDEYRKHREWKDRYRFKTRTFDFESTLPMAVNEDFSEMLETYYAEFSRAWRTQVPKDWGRLKVCFHGDLDAFERTAGASRGTLAYYRFVPPRELHFYFDRRDLEGTRSNMFHEANHYLTDLMDEKFQYPHWVNEAMAEYYGASVWDAEKKTMITGGVQPGRLVEVLSDMEAGRPYPLRKLIASDAGDYEHYYWGWSFVHFLMSSEKHGKRFRTFFNDLARARDVRRTLDSMGFTRVSGEECQRVFLHRMGLREGDLDALEAEWHAHIRALPASGVRGLEEAGRRAFATGRTLRAIRLLESALQAGSTSVLAHVALAKSLAHQNRLAEALPVMEKACLLDPIDASLWATRALLLKRSGDEAAATRLFDLAREIDPEDDFLEIRIEMAVLDRLKGKAGGGD